MTSNEKVKRHVADAIKAVSIRCRVLFETRMRENNESFSLIYYEVHF